MNYKSVLLYKIVHKMILLIQAYFFRFWRYENNGKWASDNCSDPKKLFESIVYKPENVIEWGPAFYCPGYDL